MFLADLIARRLFGFGSPTWSVLVAAFLSTSPPMGSLSAAGKTVIATLIGIAMGVACAYLSVVTPGVPTLQFAVVGAIGGLLATRSPDHPFAAVVATVVAFVASGGGGPTIEVATEMVCMILIGCDRPLGRLPRRARVLGCTAETRIDAPGRGRGPARKAPAREWTHDPDRTPSRCRLALRDRSPFRTPPPRTARTRKPASARTFPWRPGRHPARRRCNTSRPSR